ncbi:MAG: hypothetical protein H0W13_10010 [Nitrospirales bacterium]|nr:hypothetical protein [Nitrospirales bacterium]
MAVAGRGEGRNAPSGIKEIGDGAAAPAKFVELVALLSQPPQLVSEATTIAPYRLILKLLALGTPTFGLMLVNGIPRVVSKLVNSPPASNNRTVYRQVILVLTGHDDDFHQSSAALAQASGMIAFARAGAPTSTLQRFFIYIGSCYFVFKVSNILTAIAPVNRSKLKMAYFLLR